MVKKVTMMMMMMMMMMCKLKEKAWVKYYIYLSFIFMEIIILLF
jgi:hypothetical protein